MKGSTYEHQKLLNEIRLTFGSMPNVRIWPRPVGFDAVKKISYGIPGETDLDGIVAPCGRRICIEVKSGNAQLSKPQIAFRNMILKFGGIYILARSVDGALKDFYEQYSK